MAPELLVDDPPALPELLPELPPEPLLAPPPSVVSDGAELDEHPPNKLVAETANATTSERVFTMGSLGKSRSTSHDGLTLDKTRFTIRTAHRTVLCASRTERRDRDHRGAAKGRRHDEQAHAPEKSPEGRGRVYEELDAPPARRNDGGERPPGRQHPPRKSPRASRAQDGPECTPRRSGVNLRSGHEQRADSPKEERGDPREDQR